MEVIRFKNEFTGLSGLLFIIATFLACHNNDPKPLRIAVAANQTYVMDTLVKVFEEKYNTSCDVILGPSARLMTQIDQGAPYDIFLSADKSYTAHLFKKGLAAFPPKTYAIGRLVMLNRGTEALGLNDLSRVTINKIALPNPDIAPYGRIAKEELVKGGIWNSIKEKVVFGESVSQANQFYLSGNVDVAITASSVLYGPKHIRANINEGQKRLLEPSVVHYGIVVNHRKTHEKAEDFFSFILSSEGQAIFRKHGYQSVD